MLDTASRSTASTWPRTSGWYGGVDRAAGAHRGGEPEHRDVLPDERAHLGPQRGRLPVLQLEDRAANVPDREVEVVDGLVDAGRHLGVDGHRTDRLELEAGGEQALDDHVVQVAGDAFAVGDDGQFGAV